MASTASERPDARETLRPLVECCIALIVAQTLFFVLRLFARLLVKRAELGWDDYLLVPGYFVNMGGLATSLVLVHIESIGNPPGDAIIPRTPAEIKTKLEPSLKSVLAVEQLQLIGNTFPKLSILCLYLRIFPGRRTRLCTYITIGMVVVTWLGWFIFGINACTPVRKQWDTTIETGHCYAPNPTYRSFIGPNTLPDLCILLIPLPTIWKLETTNWRKVGISILFLMGSLGFIIAIVKWIVYFTHDASHIIPAVTTPLVMWLEIEPAVYFIAACLPALRPLFKLIVPASWFTSMRRGSSMNAQPSIKKSDYSTGATPGRPWDSADRGSMPRSRGSLGRLTKFGNSQHDGYGELDDYGLGKDKSNERKDSKEWVNGMTDDTKDSWQVVQSKATHMHKKQTLAELGIPWADDPAPENRHVRTMV